MHVCLWWALSEANIPLVIVGATGTDQMFSKVLTGISKLRYFNKAIKVKSVCIEWSLLCRGMFLFHLF